MSQFTDVAEKEWRANGRSSSNYGARVKIMFLCFVVFLYLSDIQNLWLLWTVENRYGTGLLESLEQFIYYVILLVKYHCHFVLSQV